MVFACQADSFCKEYETRVVSCTEAKLDGKAGYEVILEDTILFPEGGGQPDDRGTINGIEVLQISRQGEKAVHFVLEPINEGAEAELKVDWTRRFDHMQQHSGQHLLSAIIENKLGYETTSWELGRYRSHIEVDCKQLTTEDMKWIETTANDAIRNKIPVNVHVYPSASSPGLTEASTRGLPADHVGPVRVIEIEGIDKNMCCGTHVHNLSQVQVIKLFPDLDSKTRGKRLFFIAGDRVLEYLSKTMNNERSLTKLLSCGPDNHVTALERIQNSLKVVNKATKSQLRELAQLEAFKLKSSKDGQTYFYVHRENGDMDYMNTITNELGDEGVPVLVTVGPDKGPGQFLLVGQEKQVAELGPKISALLDAKGGGKKGRYQGKANSLKGRKAIEQVLKEYTSPSTNSTD